MCLVTGRGLAEEQPAVHPVACNRLNPRVVCSGTGMVGDLVEAIAGMIHMAGDRSTCYQP